MITFASVYESILIQYLITFLAQADIFVISNEFRMEMVQVYALQPYAMRRNKFSNYICGRIIIITQATVILY